MSRGKNLRPSSLGTLPVATLALLALVLLGGCRLPQIMANQPQHDPLEKSNVFADGNSSRPLVEGTVERGSGDPSSVLLTGKEGDAFVDTFPMPLTPELMARGHERYDIFCSPCHGLGGYGDGMIVARGYRKPPSFHSDQLRSRPNGYLFDVITNGFASMPPYKAQIKPEDRWAIVAYMRALQVSQNVSLDDVPQDDRAKLDGEPAHGEAQAQGETH